MGRRTIPSWSPTPTTRKHLSNPLPHQRRRSRWQKRCSQRPSRTVRSLFQKKNQPYPPRLREIRLTRYPHGESNYCRILGRYRSRGKFRTKFRTTLGGPRSRRPGSTPLGSPGGATPSPREPHAARRRRVKPNTRSLEGRLPNPAPTGRQGFRRQARHAPRSKRSSRGHTEHLRQGPQPCRMLRRVF